MKILNEASNMSTEDKMYAWANGTRREAIRLARESKLVDFAQTLARLAIHEADNNNRRLAQALTSKIMDISDEFDYRGNHSAAATVATSYASVKNRVDQILQSKDIEYQFAENAFKVYSEILTERSNDFNNITAEISRISNAQSWWTKNFIDHVYGISTASAFKSEYVNPKYLQKVINSTSCQLDTNDNFSTPDYFAKRVVTITYAVAVLLAQLELLGRKVENKYKNSGVSIKINTDWYTNRIFSLDIEVPIKAYYPGYFRMEIDKSYKLKSVAVDSIEALDFSIKYEYSIDDTPKMTGLVKADELINPVKNFINDLKPVLEKLKV